MLAGKVEIKIYVKFGILCLFKCDPKKIIHQWKAYLFSFEMTYKSKFHKMYLFMTGFVVQGHKYGFIPIKANTAEYMIAL